MPKRIPTKFDEDDKKSAIRKSQRKESKAQKPIGNVAVVSKDNLKKKGSGGIDKETKEYIKMLKTDRGKANKGYDMYEKRKK